MINLRYHIVSITAVFLALAIGLTLGTAFLDRVTVDSLQDRLERVEGEVRKTETENAELRQLLNELDDEAVALDEQLPERLLAGQLDEVPVLVVAPRGVDGDLIERSLRALRGAGASVSGVWWLTDRFALDDDDEVADLNEVLGVDDSTADAIRDETANDLAEVLASAAGPVGVTPSSTSTSVPSATSSSVPPTPAEPELVAALHDAGFIDYQGGERVLLPPAGLRYVVVSGPGAAVPDDAFLLPLVRALAAGDVAPLVVSAPSIDPDAPGDPEPDAVDVVRDDEALGERVVTVDNLDRAAGLAALVLAVNDLADRRVGHYGTRESAANLLPPPEPR